MLKSMAGLTDDYIHTVTSGLFRVSNLRCTSLDSRRIGTAQNPFAVRFILPPHPGSKQTRKLDLCPNHQRPLSPQIKLKMCLNLSLKGCTAHTHKSQLINHNLVFWCSQGISMFVPVTWEQSSSHENDSFWQFLIRDEITIWDEKLSNYQSMGLS